MTTKEKKLKNSGKKEEKRKPKYGMFSCVNYIYQILWRTERSQVFLGIAIVPVTLAVSALALYTPSIILAKLEGTEGFSTIALVILGLLLAKLLFDLGNDLIFIKSEYSEMHVFMQLRQMLNRKRRDRDWHYDYDPEIKVMDERAEKVCASNKAVGAHFPIDFANMTAAVLQFVLFGSVISLLHPLIILLLGLGCLINYWMGRWERNRRWMERDVRNDLDKKIRYFVLKMAQESKFAKDIRLYSMAEVLRERLAVLFQKHRTEGEKLERRKLLVAVVRFTVVLFRDGAAYGFLIYKAIHGMVDASSFVLYFSAITSMAEVMNSILQTVEKITRARCRFPIFVNIWSWRTS